LFLSQIEIKIKKNIGDISVKTSVLGQSFKNFTKFYVS